MRLLDYNVMVIGLSLGGLMDKIMDSGSTDTGSIPVRDAKFIISRYYKLDGVYFPSFIGYKPLLIMCCEKTNARHCSGNVVKYN